jgi:uncharacterized protein DUF4349/putative zinc finger protein
MNATTHPVTPEEVMTLFDGELSAERAQFVSSHIDECTECRATLDSIRRTRESVAKWTVPVVAAQMEDHVRKAAVAIHKLPEDDLIGSLRRFLSRRPSLAWGGAALAALLIVLGLTSVRFDKMSSVPVARAKSAVAEQQETKYQGSLGKLEPGPPPASPAVRPLFTGRDENLQLQEHGMNQVTQILGQPMIARTVSLSVVAKDFEAVRSSLDTILARHNGYAASLNVSTPQEAARTLQASLRIPAPQLAAALSELKSLGRVEAEQQNGEEVTQQHADLVARLKNSRETEQRLQDVLRTRTGKVKDVLEVEEEIARVRGEIEQMEAEQKTLEHRVDFATIDLKLAEEYKAQLTTPAPSVWMQLRNATINGFRNAFDNLLGIVLFFAESGPSLVLWLTIFGFPAWLLWRRYRRMRSQESFAGA